MKLAVITGYLTQARAHDDLFILEIPIYIDGESYVEGRTWHTMSFY